MVPMQQQVTPPQFLVNGRWQSQQQGFGTQIPVEQIVQMGDGAGSVSKPTFIGGLVGAVAGALIGGKDNRLLGAALGTGAGALAGSMVNEGGNTQQVITQQQNRCGGGKVWAKLSWPGHHQDGNMVCMAPDDQHRAGNEQAVQVANTENSRCSGGKVWAKLNWTGHHQDGNMVCMAPDDPHKGS
ncbi:glycine zipper 2TM domain-containing protein [Candidatus Gracilibacteria bacterium]|nr:glycine zipper 2TM domain-containing protein [Candidatus Gracilibacteria bacterium]